jgi:hypothetical protein
VEPADLERLADDLHSERMLRIVGFPSGRVGIEFGGSARAKRLRDYLTGRSVFDRGQMSEWVNPKEEGPTLAILQDGLRREVNARGITVEINPTSNLLIGNLGDLERHPLWRLRPPVHIDGQPSVSICIGSDDPVTFATTLREEYQLIEDTLVLAGLPIKTVSAWLDDARNVGLRDRFTLPLGTTGDVDSVRQRGGSHLDLPP